MRGGTSRVTWRPRYLEAVSCGSMGGCRYIPALGDTYHCPYTGPFFLVLSLLVERACCQSKWVMRSCEVLIFSD